MKHTAAAAAAVRTRMVCSLHYEEGLAGATVEEEDEAVIFMEFKEGKQASHGVRRTSRPKVRSVALKPQLRRKEAKLS